MECLTSRELISFLFGCFEFSIMIEKKAVMNKVFTETDTNKDYVIDANEFSNYWEKYHSH